MPENPFLSPIRIHFFARASLDAFPSVRRERRRDSFELALTFAQLFFIAQLSLNWGAYREDVRWLWRSYFPSAEVAAVNETAGLSAMERAIAAAEKKAAPAGEGIPAIALVEEVEEIPKEEEEKPAAEEERKKVGAEDLPPAPSFSAVDSSQPAEEGVLEEEEEEKGTAAVSNPEEIAASLSGEEEEIAAEILAEEKEEKETKADADENSSAGFSQAEPSPDPSLEGREISPAPVQNPPTPNTQDPAPQLPPAAFAVLPTDTRLVLSSISQNIPIVAAPEDHLLSEDWNALEAEIQRQLQDGVVHYPATAGPGEVGRMVIVGHSSFYPWDPGRYKHVFALLDKIEPGGFFSVFDKQQEFRYRVTRKEVVRADDVTILDQETGGKREAVLITCWPVGTNYKRLILLGELVE